MQTVVRVHNTSLKPFWNDELDSLKHSSIFWHNVWVSAGKPGSRYVHHLKCATKLKYKKGIRDAYIAFENSHEYELFLHFFNKRPTEFWKTWHSKFRKNVARNITIDGCENDHDIATKFATHFANVYQQADASHTPTRLAVPKQANRNGSHSIAQPDLFTDPSVR